MHAINFLDIDDIYGEELGGGQFKGSVVPRTEERIRLYNNDDILVVEGIVERIEYSFWLGDEGDEIVWVILRLIYPENKPLTPVTQSATIDTL